MDSTGLQTEIETELESGSIYMCTNSCKHNYGIQTDFCGVSVISCCLSVSLTLMGMHLPFWAIFP